MRLEWRRIYTGAGWADTHELVDPDNLMSCYGTIVRQERGKGKYWYQLTVWRPGLHWIDYTATFTSLKKAQAMGIAMVRLN